MILPTKLINRPGDGRQSGATLLVAIMMLLIITLLAISSIRGVSLESRITGNLKLQKSLTNAAEAGLRIGEQNIVCQSTYQPQPCAPILFPDKDIPTTVNIDTATRFGVNDGAVVNTVASGYDAKIQWYVVDITSKVGAISMGDCYARAQNKGGCHHYYEINSCASTVLCTSDTTTQRVIMRTVVGVSQ